MGKIVFDKCLPLKQQIGKVREYTITIRGYDLSESDRIAMVQLEGKEIKRPEEIPQDNVKQPEIAKLLTEAVATIAEQLERAYALGIASAESHETELVAISSADMPPGEVL